MRHTFLRGSVVAVAAAATLLGVPSAGAAQLGDVTRFDTWTGSPVGRNAIDVVARDLNGDGAVDAVWLRDEFFQPTLSVQLNLGDGTLGPVTTFPVTADSSDIAAGDVDGDADVDLVVVSEGSGLNNAAVDIYLNNGAGAFTRQTTPGGIRAQAVVLADLDGDADLDIALVSDGYDPSTDSTTDAVSILAGNGDGTFAAERLVRVGQGLHGIDASDLDGDGDSDLVVTRQSDPTGLGQLTVLRNDGALAFSVRPDVPLGTLGRPIVAAGRLDTDSRPDLVVAGAGERHLVLHNDGALAFTTTEYAGGFTSEDLALTDTDSDGDADVVSATQGSNARGDVTIFANNGDGTLAAAQSLTSGNQPHGVAAGDFTGDGRPDLAVANRGSGTGVIHPQRPTGSYVQPPAYVEGSSPNAITSADFDRDGDRDIATASGDALSSDAVRLLLNNGSGALSAGPALPPSGRYPREITAADLDGDGAPDLVWLTSQDSPAFHVALNSGTGTFAAPVSTSVVTGQAGQLAVADADSDGDLDVLVTDLLGGTRVHLFRNSGTGSFGAATEVATGASPEDVKAGDVDGDGVTDLVTVHNSGNGAEVRLLKGTGGGAFEAPVGFATGAREWQLVLEDVSGDNRLDAIVLSHDDTFQVLLNNAAGGFAPEVSYDGEPIAGYLNGAAIAVGDLDGDGLKDVVTANRTGNDVAVNRGLGGGRFERQAVRYGMNRGPKDVALTDLNGDGRLDLVGPNSLGGATSGSAGQATGSLALAESAAVGAAAAASTPSGGVSVLLNRGRTAGPTATTVQETSPALSYNSWRGVRDPAASGGNYRMSKTANANASFNFTATSVKWLVRKGPDRGQATVTIDGVSKGTIDLYAASPTNASLIYAGLTNARHTLVIKVLGTKRAAATAANVVVDGFLVGAATVPVQDSSPAVAYDTWTGVSNASASGGSYRVSATAGATAALSFSGTRVDWITATGPGYGKASVSVDGGSAVTVDLYRASQRWRVVAHSFTGLSAGTHTLTIKVLGTKSAAATGTKVVVDAMAVGGSR